MQVTKFDDVAVKFVRKHFGLILVVVVTIAAIAIRFGMRDFESGDYTTFLSPWFNELQEKGLREVFMQGGIGDYNCPYVILLWLLTKLPVPSLFSIKLVSVIFDFGLAAVLALIARHIMVEKGKQEKSEFAAVMTYVIVILLPTVIANSSMWAQCDSIYAFFVAASVYMLMRKKFTPAFLLLGCAFSFKLQFIFVVPVYLIVYLKNKEFSILNFLWVPVVLLVLSLPAIICGFSVIDVFGVYFKQIGEYKLLTLSMPNFYMLFDGYYGHVSLIGYAICLMAFGGVFYYVIRYFDKISAAKMVELIVLSVLICTCFLPSMHERYAYLACVFSIVYFVTGCGPLIVPVLIELVSLTGYFNFLYDNGAQRFEVMAVIYIATTMFVGARAMAPQKKIK